MDIGVCNSYMQVDLSKIKRNIEKIRSHIGENMEILPVLKGNAYGMGLVQIGKFLAAECAVKMFATAQTYEALKMLEAGICADYFVMGGVAFNNIATVVAKDIQVPAYNIEFLNLLQEEAQMQGKMAKVHIKVETGLNRIGVKPGEDLDAFCQYLQKLKNIYVVGAYTHFTDAETLERNITLEQYNLFKEGIAQIKSYEFPLEYIHACNSAAATWLDDKLSTHIRPAGLCLGFDPVESPVNILGIEEPMTWRSFITNVKTVKKGETVGYNRVFEAKSDIKVITMSFGYGDGYNRGLAFSGADVLVRGKRAPIIGICMDQTFADVSHIPDISMNDTVTIIGRDGDAFISVFELQHKMNQTYLATIAAITDRVKRIYVK